MSDGTEPIARSPTDETPVAPAEVEAPVELGEGQAPVIEDDSKKSTSTGRNTRFPRSSKTAS
jgi:hypothetical protein